MAQHDAPAGLPAPDEEAAAHSARLTARIREEMAAAGGALPFARFMELALYAPGLGYYSAGSRKFGAAGDFVTAPEVSPLFGRCLARSCRGVLERTGGDVLEFGAGSGALAADVLLELEALNALPERYCILEISGELRERQRETLARRCPGLASRVEWLDALPASFAGVVLANEVLDALPVERFRKGGADLVEQACIADDGEAGFRWHWRPAPEGLRAAVAAVEADLGRALPPGYTSELCPLLPPWIRSLGDVLRRGLVLLVDYGYPRREYYHPQRSAGTLMCHYRHRAHDDPLVLVGLQDITAHVDFSAVAASAEAAGLELVGFTSQAQFLLHSGMAEILQQSDPTDTRAHLELARQAKLLTLPGEMGERFKVMGLARALDAPPPGFSPADLRGRL